MLAIELTFPTGRYHATPWGSHVNEATVEWPPSPWRLLRALVSTWYLKADEEIDEAVMGGLVEALASELPAFHLPEGQPAHTRHYMALYSGSTTKVFDAFIHVGSEPSYLVWEKLDLDTAEQAALEILISRLAYLGRAESWVAARCVATPPESASLNVVPTVEDGREVEGELVRVLAPLPRPELERWHDSWEDKRLTRLLDTERTKLEAKGKPADSIRLSEAKKAKETEDLPTSVLEALHASTTELRGHGWSQPPGTRWVTYQRPHDLLRARQPAARRLVSRHRPTVARFAISSKVLPRFQDTLYLAEQFRASVLSHLGEIEKEDSKKEECDKIRDLAEARGLLCGRSGADEPARGHGHVHFFAEPNVSGGRIGQVSLYAPDHFNEAALTVLRRARVLWRRNGHPIELVLLGVGDSSDFAGSNVSAGQAPIFSSSRRWRSMTPFVSTRHLHRSERRDPGRAWEAIKTEIRRYLAAAGHPDPVEIHAVERCQVPGTAISWSRFATRRSSGGGSRGDAPPMGVELVFDRDVTGPLCLGYGAHFGLGLFAPRNTYG